MAMMVICVVMMSLVVISVVKFTMGTVVVKVSVVIGDYDECGYSEDEFTLVAVAVMSRMGVTMSLLTLTTSVVTVIMSVV